MGCDCVTDNHTSYSRDRFLVAQLPQIPTLLVCVSDSTNNNNELVNEGEVLANSKDHVFFLRTDGYWQRKSVLY